MPKGNIDIKIPLDAVYQEFKLAPQQVDQMRETVKIALISELHRQWQDAAKKGLNQTRDQYIRGLLIADDNRFAGSIVLTGALPNMVESGVSAFDLKEGFKKSAKVKYNKQGGWYITIPFRFATPGAGGFSSVFAGVLPTEIYNLIKGGTGKQTTPFAGNVGTGTTRLKQADIPDPYNIPKTRERVIAESVKTVYDQYVNKFSIYAGLQRDEKFYEKTGQSTYNTFRRAGQNGDPLSWIHTGITARHYAEQAVQNTDVDTLVNNTVDQLLSEWGFGS